MTFLPIVDRELRVASRRRGTFWLRTFLVVAVLLIWFVVLISQSQNMASAERSKVLFHSLAVMALGFCLLAGVFLTADALSEERRQGTLGLLFLTDLKGYDVVLGKLMATSLHAFYGVLAILPLLALPLLMGGVTVGEFWRMTTVLLTTLFLSLAVGMFVSSFTRETRQAMSWTLLILVILAGLLPTLWWLIALVSGRRSWDILLWPSPGYLYGLAADSSYRTLLGSKQFFISLLVIIGLAAAALVLASFRLPYAWQSKAETDAPQKPAARLWRFGSETRKARRRARLENNPFYWLTTRDRRPMMAAWIAMAVFLLVWLGFMTQTYSNAGFNVGAAFAISFLLAFVMHALLKILVAIEASRRLSDDRNSGALELLLVTPIAVEKIFDGQRRALLETFRAPLLIVLAVNVGLFARLVDSESLHMGSEPFNIFCEVLLGGTLVLATDFLALSWLSMSQALRTRKHHRAIFGTLARVMLPPWAGIGLFLIVSIGSGINTETMMFLMGLWFGLSALLDFALAGRAKMELNTMRQRLAFAPGS